MSRDTESRLFHEITGLILLGLGTLLFLALVSYDARDVPGWFPLAYATEANVTVQNFIGKVGAMIACTFYFLLGAASYLVSVLLFGCGAVKLMNPLFSILRRMHWIIICIVSATSILAIQPFTLRSWTRVMKAAGPGGEMGDLLGTRLIEPLFGVIGSLVLLGLIYFVSLIRITGIRPIVVLRKILGIIPALRMRYRAWQLARADEEERLVLEHKRLLAEQKKLERQLSRRKKKTTRLDKPETPRTATDDDIEDEDDTAPLFDEDRPAPRVIDTTAPRKPTTPRPPKPEPTRLINPNATTPDYIIPPLELLDPLSDEERAAADPEEMRGLQNTIIDTLQQFNIEVAPGDITRGPTITRYEVYPAKGIRVDKIVSLERDIARATCAERINILAPIPGKDTVGIEIANSKKQKVTLRELLESDDWENSKAKIPLILGKDVYGNSILGDLASMPHLLVAGTTGSGKSVCINSIIASILYRFKPDELRFIMIDPKVVEMQVYNKLPHLIMPVVTDPKKVILALRKVIDEMENRYKIFAKVGVRNISSFNSRPDKPKRQSELDAEAAALANEGVEAAVEAPALNRIAPVVTRTAVAAGPSILDRLRGPEEDDEPTTPTSDEERAPWEEPLEPTAEAHTFITEEEPAEEEEIANVEESEAEISGQETESDEPSEENEAPEDDEEDTSEDENEDAEEPEDLAAPPPPIRVRRDDDIEIPEGDMPYIVVIIDELADLMQTAPADVESAIARITQMARAAGIHMIVATQTPRADVITGVIKANIPTRIAFQVASGLDSRIILDEKGAERLLGQGDMMYVPPGTSKMTRAQGVFVTDDEIRKIVEYTARQAAPNFDSDLYDQIFGENNAAEEVSEEDEELVQKCIEIMKQEKRASTSLFQRRLRLGYTRAARVVDILEQRRYIAPGEGAKPREILVDLDDLI